MANELLQPGADEGEAVEDAAQRLGLAVGGHGVEAERAVEHEEPGDFTRAEARPEKAGLQAAIDELVHEHPAANAPLEAVRCVDAQGDEGFVIEPYAHHFADAEFRGAAGEGLSVEGHGVRATV